VDYDDRGLASMPKLVGGPKYTRPPVVAFHPVERPPDPDDLPLESARTPDDEAMAQDLGLSSSLAAAGVSDKAAGRTAAHPGSTQAKSGGKTGGKAETSSSRRRLGGLFRGRNGKTGAA